MTPGSPRPGGGASATRVLGDRRSRAVLERLVDAGDRPVPADELLAAVDETTPRALRDHLGRMARWKVVRAVRPETAAASAGWTLEPSGRDLQRVSALMTRIVSNTLRIPRRVDAARREEVARLVLETLDDPIVVEVVRTLAVRPRFAGELEAACAHVAPRRSLYRRLARLIEVGAIERQATHEVPRRAIYQLTDGWRPLALLLLLGAWWEWRYADPAENALASDLEALTHAVAPLTRLGSRLDGARVRWTVEQPAGDRTIVLVGADGRIDVEPAAPTAEAGDADAEVRATADAWCAALVTKDRGGLSVEGDAAVATRVGAAVRAALLAPLRR